MDEDSKDLIKTMIASMDRIAEAIEDSNYLVREDMGIVSLEDV